MLAPLENCAFQFYDLIWKAALPFLKLNRRLAEGINQRLFISSLPEPANIWIQAASVGEAFLAVDLVKRLRPDRAVSVLLTTNTLQGKNILDRFIPETSSMPHIIRTQSAFFPFDRPTIMHRAVQLIRPDLMILLEAEIWPAHLAALKNTVTPIIVVNGRLSSKSLRRYRFWPSLWHRMAPDRVLAMSVADAHRFAVLFGRDRVKVINNLKFDRLDFQHPTAELSNPLRSLFEREAKILVLGSVRREEEENVNRIVSRIRSVQPKTVICIFPRHTQRLDAWSAILDRQHNPWTLRSRIVGSVSPGSVILWDSYGELVQAYELCRAAFVGGSLVPLGGQNFLEAMASGVVPIIGPHWDNFFWVGKEVVARGLVRIAADWRQAADLLAADLAAKPKRETVRQKALRFVQERQGGMASACRLIEGYMRNPPLARTSAAENRTRHLNRRREEGR
jgi:3-deoxy-D-manno-octulosonic-acid transferase